MSVPWVLHYGRLWRLQQVRFTGCCPGLRPALDRHFLLWTDFLPSWHSVLHTGPSTAVASTPRSIPGVKALGLWFCFAPGLAAVTNPSLCLPLYDNPLRLVFSPSL